MENVGDGGVGGEEAGRRLKKASEDGQQGVGITGKVEGGEQLCQGHPVQGLQILRTQAAYLSKKPYSNRFLALKK
jgi:hypothetical protein